MQHGTEPNNSMTMYDLCCFCQGSLMITSVLNDVKGWFASIIPERILSGLAMLNHKQWYSYLYLSVLTHSSLKNFCLSREETKIRKLHVLLTDIAHSAFIKPSISLKSSVASENDNSFFRPDEVGVKWQFYQSKPESLWVKRERDKGRWNV